MDRHAGGRPGSTFAAPSLDHIANSGTIAAQSPNNSLSAGLRLSAMAVYLAVFQRVPVERAQRLISVVSRTGRALALSWAG